MPLKLTEASIRRWCGRFAYEDGEAALRSGNVVLVPDLPNPYRFKGEVYDSPDLSRPLTIDLSGETLQAECSCPDFYPGDLFCRHIAAALLTLRRAEREEPASEEPEPEGEELAEQLLGLFADKPLRKTAAGRHLDERTVLAAAFTCRIFPLGNRGYGLGIELGLGSKRMYAVKDIGSFLAAFEAGLAWGVTPSFTYDPMRHSLAGEDDAVLKLLARIARGEALMPEFGSKPARAARLLAVPPSRWKELEPLLQSASRVTLEGKEGEEGPFAVADTVLPLEFRFGHNAAAAAGYALTVSGLNRVTVLEAYGLAVAAEAVYELAPRHLARLAGLQAMLGDRAVGTLPMNTAQAEAFIASAVPGLRRLGTVTLSEEVSGLLQRAPLQASLFLDRVKDRLLAGLEFRYGNVVIDPMEDRETAARRGEAGLLIRDGEKERDILGLMAETPFTVTEGGWILADEDGEFEFLYRVLPRLGKLAKIYATSAVKINMNFVKAPPKIKAELSGRNDWLEFTFDISDIPEAEIRLILESLQAKRRYHRLPGGMVLPLENADYAAIVAFLNDPSLGKWEMEEGKIRVPLLRGLQLAQAGNEQGRLVLGRTLRELLARLLNPDLHESPYPEGFAPVLREYQKYGYQWMKTLAGFGFGGILADEMGLGKTVQAIAFLSSVLPEIRQSGRQALIVCPSSLMYNWLSELRRFAPGIRAETADGGAEAREMVRGSDTGLDVIITSYPLLRRDAAFYGEMSFHTLILDEAQYFKNEYTQTAQAVKDLRASHRFALTGTPVENRLEELRSICEAVLPGLFPGRREFAELPRETVARRIAPFLLRRLKADCLAELPPKIESLQVSDLFPEQRKLYAAYLAELREETLKHLRDGDLQRHRVEILAGITRLRQLCCHPALFVEGYTGSSAKFEQLLEMVEEYRAAGRRMLVFSQFTSMLDLIGRRLADMDVPYLYLDGQTPARERVELCERFNGGESEVFLLSLKAGGTGLNLTGADTIILYDLWWNPAVEQQAADRAHRIGQKRVVQVIRLVAKGTVEDKMFELQRTKRDLLDEVVKPGHESLSALGEQEIRDILQLDEP